MKGTDMTYNPATSRKARRLLTDAELHALGAHHSVESHSREEMDYLDYWDGAVGQVVGKARYEHFLDGWTWAASGEDEYAYGHSTNTTPASGF